MQTNKTYIEEVDATYYIAPDKYAEGGTRKYLVEKDNYIIPLQITAHAIDSPDIEGMEPDQICVGIDAISNRLSYWGGGVDVEEKLEQALLREGREECGDHRNTRIIDKRIVTFASLNDKWNGRINDDTSTDDPSVGLAFKLRTVFRVASRMLPVQQKPLEGHIYPEFLRPHYEPITNVMSPGRLIRKSCLFALEKAARIGNLMLDTSGPSVEPDMEMLALEWQKMHIHPAIIDYYCGGYSKIPSLRQKYMELYGDIIAPVMMNMQYQEAGLNQLLRHKLPNELNILKTWKKGCQDAAL